MHKASSTSPKFRKQVLKWNRQRAAGDVRDKLMMKLIFESVKARYPGSQEQMQNVAEVKNAVLKMINDDGGTADLDVPARIVLDLLTGAAGTGEAATISCEVLGFSGHTLKTNIVMKLVLVHSLDAAHAVSLADTMLTGGGGRRESHADSDAFTLLRHQLVLRGVQWQGIHEEHDEALVVRRLNLKSQAETKPITDQERQKIAEGVDRLLHVSANRNIIRATYLSALNAVAISPEQWERVIGSESEWHRKDNPVLAIDFYMLERCVLDHARKSSSATLAGRSRSAAEKTVDPILTSVLSRRTGAHMSLKFGLTEKESKELCEALNVTASTASATSISQTLSELSQRETLSQEMSLAFIKLELVNQFGTDTNDAVLLCDALVAAKAEGLLERYPTQPKDKWRCRVVRKKDLPTRLPSAFSLFCESDPDDVSSDALEKKWGEMTALERMPFVEAFQTNEASEKSEEHLLTHGDPVQLSAETLSKLLDSESEQLEPDGRRCLPGRSHKASIPAAYRKQAAKLGSRRAKETQGTIEHIRVGTKGWKSVLQNKNPLRCCRASETRVQVRFDVTGYTMAHIDHHDDFDIQTFVAKFFDTTRRCLVVCKLKADRKPDQWSVFGIWSSDDKEYTSYPHPAGTSHSPLDDNSPIRVHFDYHDGGFVYMCGTNDSVRIVKKWNLSDEVVDAWRATNPESDWTQVNFDGRVLYKRNGRSTTVVRPTEGVHTVITDPHSEQYQFESEYSKALAVYVENDSPLWYTEEQVERIDATRTKSTADEDRVTEGLPAPNELLGLLQELRQNAMLCVAVAEIIVPQQHKLVVSLSDDISSRTDHKPKCSPDLLLSTIDRALDGHRLLQLVDEFHQTAENAACIISVARRQREMTGVENPHLWMTLVVLAFGSKCSHTGKLARHALWNRTKTLCWECIALIKLLPEPLVVILAILVAPLNAMFKCLRSEKPKVQPTTSPSRPVSAANDLYRDPEVARVMRVRPHATVEAADSNIQGEAVWIQLVGRKGTTEYNCGLSGAADIYCPAID
jgi:hypothetical protein